jgi:hypothetical protein
MAGKSGRRSGQNQTGKAGNSSGSRVVEARGERHPARGGKHPKTKLFTQPGSPYTEPKKRVRRQRREQT